MQDWHIDTSSEKEILAIVTGRVQMVMYRDFATRKARSLGVSGTVRNMPDGSVEVIAQGARAALESYIKKLEKGSLLSHVENVAVSWREPTAALTSFTILY